MIQPHRLFTAIVLLAGTACVLSACRDAAVHDPAEAVVDEWVAHESVDPIRVDEILAILRQTDYGSRIEPVSKEGEKGSQKRNQHQSMDLLAACIRIAQAYDSATIGEAIRLLDIYEPHEENSAKLFVLVRVVCDVPEWMDEDEYPVHGKWLYMDRREGRVNSLWPLQLTDSGALKLVSVPVWVVGSPYDGAAAEEFKYFLDKYGRRSFKGQQPLSSNVSCFEDSLTGQ